MFGLSMRVGWVAAAAAAGCLGLATASTAFVLAPTFDQAPADFPQVTVVAAMGRWDAGWYADIARSGYWYRPGQQSPVAFFPGYPLAMRALGWLGMNRWVAGMVITALAGLAAVVLFTRWARTLKDAETAWTAGLMLALYPFAFYLYGAIYSDALFLLLAVSAFLALERDRLWLATLLGAAATATRPVAPALVLGLLVRQLERRRSAGLSLRPVDFAPVLAAAGLAAFMTFLGLRFDDPLAFAHVQAAPGWDQPAGWSTWLKVPLFRTLFPRVDPLVAVRLLGHAFVALAALALAVPTRRHLGWGYAVYVGLAVGMPALFSKDFQGLGRYAMAAFPCFLTLACLLQRRPRVRWAYLVASALLLGVLAFAFGAGGYVA